jgi:hypothetical protein
MRISITAGVALLAASIGGNAFATDPNDLKWGDSEFTDGVIKAGTFMLLDSSERLGGWRTVGENGNVAWTSGSYKHHGFNFYAQKSRTQATATWINLAGLSQSATGLMHVSVATTAGASYTLTFYVGNIYDPNGVYGTTSTVVVYANTSLLGSFTNSDGQGSVDENWKQFSTTFVATAPYTVVAFINGDPPGDMNCGLDTVVLAATHAASPRSAP